MSLEGIQFSTKQAALCHWTPSEWDPACYQVISDIAPEPHLTTHFLGHHWHHLHRFGFPNKWMPRPDKIYKRFIGGNSCEENRVVQRRWGKLSDSRVHMGLWGREGRRGFQMKISECNAVLESFSQAEGQFSNDELKAAFCWAIIG